MTTKDTTSIFTRWQLLSFGVLTTPLALAGFTLVFYLPNFYALEMGLGLTAVGLVLALGRVFDVITDPLIGHFSDQTRGRSGPRAPWILLGAPIFALAVWLFLAPPEGAGLIYLIAVSGLFFLTYTIVDVPYSSIGLEISPDPHERSLLASSKSLFQIAGALAASLIPLVLGAAMGLSLKVIAVTVIVMLAVGLFTLFRFVPAIREPNAEPRLSLWSGLRWLWTRPQYRSLIGAFFMVQSANALTAGLTVLYVTHVIGAPELIGAFFLIIFTSTALCLPVWLWIARRQSKRAAWITSLIVCSAALAVVPFVGATGIAGFAMFCVILGGVFGCDAIMPTSMLADIIGKTDGSSRTGATALAVKNAVSKLTFVVPMAIAFPLLDLVGFQEAGENSPMALSVLTIFFAGVPVAIRLLTALVVWRAPLSTLHLTGSG